MPRAHPGPLPKEREKRSQLFGGAATDSCARTHNFNNVADGCSLSPRERVRVRGKTIHDVRNSYASH